MDLPEIVESAQLFPNRTVAEFHALMKRSNTEGPPGPPWARWRGYVALKCPLDLWVYQELLSSIYIGTVIENGTAGGGSTLFLADTCEALNRGTVISVDWEKNLERPLHSRVNYVTGDTLNVETVREALQLRAIRNQPGHTMLILDDGHSKDHVFQELHTWTPILRSGDVLIVEDTDLGGPYWGLQAFMHSQEDRWERLEWCEKFLMTQNPYGYWRKR